jgi:hypothetical protein
LQLDQWSTWFDKKFGKFTRDPRHHEGMKGAALMTILIIFMFVPQMFFKAAVPCAPLATPLPLPSSSACGLLRILIVYY